MAMKLNTTEKANDSIIRAFNKQIENAYRNLGYNNTITQNLVNTAINIYGKSAMKEMKITIGFSANQIDKTTGDIYGIPQIQRNRANVANTTKAKALKAETQYTSGDKKGQYKHMYDVSKAYQKAIKQARQNIIKSLPNETIKLKTPKQLEKEIRKQLTRERISKQILENDLASEIFAAYEDAKEDGDDIELYQEYANNYHSGGDADLDLINRIAEQRYKTLIDNSLENPDEDTGLTGERLNEFLQGFEEIYNPFE